MADKFTSHDMIALRIAGLELQFDARGSGLNLSYPSSHTKFGVPLQASADDHIPGSQSLKLEVRIGSPATPGSQAKLICQTKIWELWQDDSGRMTFFAPNGSKPQQVIIEPDFSSGELYGHFYADGAKGLYPLVQGLEIVLFSNWLATTGDIILHASGAALGGKGYCFAGQGGAGKSTLAAALSMNPEATILGEDQVILRHLGGRFWIFGTPWHIDPAMCSPLGVPLEKVFFLDRSASPDTQEITSTDGVTHLLQSAFIPYYRPELVPGILDNLSIMAETMTFLIMNYHLKSDPWHIICTD